ncbi:MAG: hypothetical protein ACFE95_03445 [Candidatus Hodarchaeota archaeon]
MSLTKKMIILSIISLLIFFPLMIEFLDSIAFDESITIADNKQMNHKTEWNQTYGGTGLDWAKTLIQTTDGGYLLAGCTDSFGSGDTDMWLVKIDAIGEIKWNQTYGGPQEDCANALLQTMDGGYLVAGFTYSFGSGGADMWLVKIDTNGVTQWSKTYGGQFYEAATVLLQTKDGGFGLAGLTRSFGVLERDIWLVKTDSNGIVQWNQTYGGPNNDWANTLLQTPDEGFVLAGGTQSFGSGESDMWLVKTDAKGAIQWNQTYGGPKDEWVNALLQTSDNGFALAGFTRSYGVLGRDAWLVKTDVNGIIQWNQTYGGIGTDELRTIIPATDGGFVLAGNTAGSFGKNGFDMWLIRTDVNGSMQWHQTYGGSKHEVLSSCIQTLDGGFGLAGLISPTTSVLHGRPGVLPDPHYITCKKDMWVVKTEPINGKSSNMEILPIFISIFVLTLLFKRKR